MKPNEKERKPGDDGWEGYTSDPARLQRALKERDAKIERLTETLEDRNAYLLYTLKRECGGWREK